MRVVTFRELLEEVYLRSRGESLMDALHTIRRECGKHISIPTLRAAWRGTQVEVATAKKLMLWSQEYHPGLTLHYDALISAPTAPARRSRAALWSKKRPIVSGNYWARHHVGGIVLVGVTVWEDGRSHDQDRAAFPGSECTERLDAFTHWMGPLQPPPPPEAQAC